jgi:abequosyltransferase
MFIGETLESILPGLSDDVEIVILDGGSTDDTGAVVAQKIRGFRQIHFFQQGYRGGIDRDIAKVVRLAQGEYCWLVSADDIMKPEAINKVLNAIQSHCDIYLCEHTLCTFDMEPIEEYSIFDTISTPTIFDLGKAEDRKKYFSAARTSEAFFSFLSGPIFRRDLWKRTDNIPSSFYETCWALAGRMLSLVQGGLVVHYLGENLLYKRGGNDSFSENGVVNRLRISVDGFAHIAETIFGKHSVETWHIRRVIRNERTLLHLMLIKLQASTSPQKENIDQLNQIVSRHYSDAGITSIIKCAIFKLTPVFMLRIGAFLKKNIMKAKYLLTPIFFLACCIVCSVNMGQ